MKNITYLCKLPYIFCTNFFTFFSSSNGHLFELLAQLESCIPVQFCEIGWASSLTFELHTNKVVVASTADPWGPQVSLTEHPTAKMSVGVNNFLPHSMQMSVSLFLTLTSISSTFVKFCTSLRSVYINTDYLHDLNF